MLRLQAGLRLDTIRLGKSAVKRPTVIAAMLRVLAMKEFAKDSALNEQTEQSRQAAPMNMGARPAERPKLITVAAMKAAPRIRAAIPHIVPSLLIVSRSLPSPILSIRKLAP